MCTHAHYVCISIWMHISISIHIYIYVTQIWVYHSKRIPSWLSIGDMLELCALAHEDALSSKSQRMLQAGMKRCKRCVAGTCANHHSVITTGFHAMHTRFPAARCQLQLAKTHCDGMLCFVLFRSGAPDSSSESSCDPASWSWAGSDRKMCSVLMVWSQLVRFLRISGWPLLLSGMLGGWS